MGVRPGTISEADELETPAGDAGAGFAEIDVLRHRQVREQRAVLEHHAHAPLIRLDPAAVPGDLTATDPHVAAVGLFETSDETQQRGLARPARAEHSDDLTIGDLDRGIVDGGRRSESLDDVLGGDRRRRSAHPPNATAPPADQHRSNLLSSATLTTRLWPSKAPTRSGNAVPGPHKIATHMPSKTLGFFARRPWVIILILVVPIAVVVVLAVTRDDSEALVIYNGRSHYGDEQIFRDFEEATGIEVEIRGGTSLELFERLRREGDDTSADVFVTTDLPSLWRAQDAGLLQEVSTPALVANVSPELADEAGTWWPLSTRLRVPVISTERVEAGSITSYEDLGDPEFAGRTCLRTSNNEYNQSLVADMIAKRGYAETETLLRSWMANDPEILNSDGELLAVMAGGECDVGLTNHYYLGRALDENADFPVAPAWPDQDGVGAHANISGVAVVNGTSKEDDAIALIEFLTSADAQSVIVDQNSEFAANPEIPPAAHISEWADVVIDPASNEAGTLFEEAIALMADVGWR